MPKYAHVFNGSVVEFFTTDQPISSLFHPSLTWVDVTGIDPQPIVGWRASRTGDVWTFSAPPSPDPLPAPQQAALALSGGLTIASTANHALNGTYAVDPASQADIVAIETSVVAGRGFPPGGATTFSYPDATGTRHTFNESEFANFAAAVRDYIYSLRAVIGGSSTTLPPSSVTIP